MTLRTAGAVAVAVAAFAASPRAGTNAAARTFSMDDLRTLVGVTSPAVAPDGKRAVVVVTRIEWNDDRYDRDLDVIDLATHARRTLTYHRKGLSSPRWSPDGTKLAFLASEGDESQVFMMPMDGGDARPVTNAPAGVEQFAWRPDGGAIAYVAADAPPKKTGADRFRDAFVVGNTPITAQKAPPPLHLFVAGTEPGAKPRQLTHTEGSVAAGEAESTLSWSPDGKTIAFVLAPDAVLNDAWRAHIDLVDVESGKLSRLTTHAGYEADPLFSPDGKRVAYGHSTGDPQITLNEMWVAVPGAGNGEAASHAYDRAVNQFAWLPDSGGVLCVAHDGTTNAIVRAPVDARDRDTLRRVDVGDLVISSRLDGAIARDGSIVFVASSPKRPPELYLKRGDAAPVALTDYNAKVAALDLASAERITYATSTGTQADGVLVTPPGFSASRTYPLVVHIHGGPTSASLLQFDRQTQLMAARGWLVLQPNYRGSDNLGYAYQHAVQYDPEEGPGKDIMAAIDAVRSRGIVDPHRMVVGGWSYGGIMTAWMISKYHVWRAAVSGASVNDWFVDYGVADDLESDKALFHGSPYVGDNAAEYKRASAITYARDVTTPVLIISDVGDNRDPFATSSMYYHALRDNRKNATFVAYPVEGHFPRDPVRTADVYARWMDYFAARLR